MTFNVFECSIIILLYFWHITVFKKRKTCQKFKHDFALRHRTPGVPFLLRTTPCVACNVWLDYSLTCVKAHSVAMDPATLDMGDAYSSRFQMMERPSKVSSEARDARSAVAPTRGIARSF